MSEEFLENFSFERKTDYFYHESWGIHNLGTILQVLSNEAVNINFLFIQNSV